MADLHIAVVIGIAPTKAATEQRAGYRRQALQPFPEKLDQFGLAHGPFASRLWGIATAAVYDKAFLAALMARDIAGSGSG